MGLSSPEFSIDLLAQRPRKAARKQIQPEIGPEKAFGQALREIRKGKEVSQERKRPVNPSGVRTGKV